MNREVYAAGVLREQWSYTTRLYTTWNASGVQTSQRAFTAAENTQADSEVAAALRGTNRVSVEDKALSALAANDTYLAITNPSNAQIAAQVKTLTRECSGLIRLMLSQLDTTVGT